MSDTTEASRMLAHVWTRIIETEKRRVTERIRSISKPCEPWDCARHQPLRYRGGYARPRRKGAQQYAWMAALRDLKWRDE